MLMLKQVQLSPPGGLKVVLAVDRRKLGLPSGSQRFKGHVVRLQVQRTPQASMASS